MENLQKNIDKIDQLGKQQDELNENKKNSIIWFNLLKQKMSSKWGLLFLMNFLF